MSNYEDSKLAEDLKVVEERVHERKRPRAEEIVPDPLDQLFPEVTSVAGESNVLFFNGKYKPEEPVERQAMRASNAYYLIVLTNIVYTRVVCYVRSEPCSECFFFCTLSHIS